MKSVLLVLAICSSVASSSVSPHQCPTWFVPDGSGNRCKCGSAAAGVECHEDSKKIFLYGRRCVTFNESIQLVTIGFCRYNLHSYGTIELPQNVTRLNVFMCGGLNRTGVLCSHCEPGLGPPLLSYEVKCLQCLDDASGWLLFIFLACVPSTVLFFILLFFQVRATSATMNCFILLAQTYNFTLVESQWLITPGGFGGLKVALAKMVATFYGFWVLDFFRLFIPPFCAGSSTRMLHILALEYIVAVYPLALVVVVYFCVKKYGRGSRVLVCLWVPFRICFTHMQRVWDPSRSLVQAFASFLILAYCKILFVSVTLLQFTELYNDRGISTGKSKMTYYNASVQYFGSEHAPLGVLALFMFVVFNLLPIVFLFLYPSRLFQSCLNYCKIRSHALHIFADTFNGCYKNGFGDTRDYRWFSGFYMLLRVAVLLLELVRYTHPYIILCCTATGFFLLLARPYKDDFFNFLDFSLFCSIGIACAVGMITKENSGSISLIFYLTAVIPALYFIFYVIARVVLYLRILDKCQSCQRFKRLLEQATADFGVPRRQGGTYDEQPLAGSPFGVNASTRYGAIIL